MDFYDTLTGRHIELTTLGQKRLHQGKGGEYSTCAYGIYDWNRD